MFSTARVKHESDLAKRLGRAVNDASYDRELIYSQSYFPNPDGIPSLSPGLRGTRYPG